jgi:hypothetical protein
MTYISDLARMLSTLKLNYFSESAVGGGSSGEKTASAKDMAVAR